MAEALSLEQRRAVAAMNMRLRASQAAPVETDTTSGAPYSVRAKVGSMPQQLSPGAGPDFQLQALQKAIPGGNGRRDNDGNLIFDNPKTGQPTRYNPEGLDVGDIFSIAPEIGEAVGGGVGAAAGFALGSVPGSIAGAGGGAIAGKSEVEKAAMLSQGIPDTRGFAEKALGALETGALNAAGQGIGEGIGIAGRIAAKSAMRGTGGKAEAQSAISDMARFGVTPSIGQATKNFAMDAAESLSAKFPGGSGVIRKTAEIQQKKIAASMAEKLTNLAGIAPEELAAGGVIRQGIEDFSNNFIDQAKVLYKEVDKYLPPNSMVSTANTHAMLNEVATPIKDAENFSKPLLNPKLTQMLGGLNADLDHYGGDTLPYEAISGMRSKVGRELGSISIGPDAIPRAELKRVYAALTSDMRIAAQAQGPNALKAFDRASAFYKAGMDRIDTMLEPIVKSGLDRDVFAAIESSGKQGPERLRAVRDSVSSDQWKILAATVAGRLGRPPAGQRGEGEALFSLQKFLSGYQTLRDAGSADVLFGGPGMGGIKQDLDALARAADRTSVSSKSFFNPPGTATALTGANIILMSIGGLIGGAPGLAGTAALATTGSYGIAKMMVSPTVVHWLAEGTRVAPNGLGAWIGRASAVAADADPDVREAIQGFLGNMATIAPQPLAFTPPGGKAP